MARGHELEALAAEAKVASLNSAEKSRGLLDSGFSELEAVICDLVALYHESLAISASRRSMAIDLDSEYTITKVASTKKRAQLALEFAIKMETKAARIKSLILRRQQQFAMLRKKQAEILLNQQEAIQPNGPQPGKSLLQKLARHIPQGVKRWVRKIFNRP